MPPDADVASVAFLAALEAKWEGDPLRLEVRAVDSISGTDKDGGDVRKYPPARRRIVKEMRMKRRAVGLPSGKPPGLADNKFRRRIRLGVRLTY